MFVSIIIEFTYYSLKFTE